MQKNGNILLCQTKKICSLNLLANFFHWSDLTDWLFCQIFSKALLVTGFSIITLPFGYMELGLPTLKSSIPSEECIWTAMKYMHPIDI